MFSSKTDQWATPADFFARLDQMFGPFDLDPCADDTNAKAARYFTEADDGLAQSWAGSVFCNPPYGRGIGAWIQKAYEESERGARVVMLIPARTDTAYWHEYVMKARAVYFVRGRLKFGAATNCAPFPSAVVVFNGGGPAGHAPACATIDANDRGTRQ